MDLEQSILPYLGKTVKLIDLHVEERLAEAGVPLSKIQFVILKNISNNNGQPQCNLAYISGRFKTTFTRNINTLEKNKLVTRKPSSQDKRIKNIFITTLGQEFLDKSYPVFNELVKEIQSDIPKNDLAVLINTLNKIQSKLI